MNSADFIAKALSIARDYKTSYIWGGLGSPITDASLTRAADAYDVISVRVPKDLAAAFREKCDAEGAVQAQIIKRAIEEFLQK